MDYFQGSSPNSAYEMWKSRWVPPKVRPFAMPGKAIVEFSPYGTESPLWKPEQASFNAKIVDDGAGELTPGTEVVLEANDGANFVYEGRRFTAVNREDILLLVTT